MLPRIESGTFWAGRVRTWSREGLYSFGPYFWIRDILILNRIRSAVLRLRIRNLLFLLVAFKVQAKKFFSQTFAYYLSYHYHITRTYCPPAYLADWILHYNKNMAPDPVPEWFDDLNGKIQNRKISFRIRNTAQGHRAILLYPSHRVLLIKIRM